MARRSEADRQVIHLAASNGGHLDLLIAVKDALRGYTRVWITPDSAPADELRRQGETVHSVPRYDRQLMGKAFLRSVAEAARLVASERPRLVVTSGAGAMLPFCALARATGARLIFVETMARVTSRSASGTVLSRLASNVLVQWPEAVPLYPRSKLCNPALLEEVAPSGYAGDGTFVAVGTHRQPFDRLLQIVDDAARGGALPLPVHAQLGVSQYRPRHYQGVDWLTPDEIDEAIGRAQCVVTHAGSGLISAALRNGRRPLVLPRLAGLGEHVDDHQEQLAWKLGTLGLVVRLNDEISLDDIERATAPLPVPDMRSAPSVTQALERELSAGLK
jgi:UDP-N-acetylglucosamine--N-acetylmuramyl-(pentapeptide) pyrophosphoryl-undecaprenol N-acetylglucosamine transferase